MAIKAYVGLMGSGKTYEVVKEVILGALRIGRRVVTNIAGIDYQAMRDLLIEEGVGSEKIGLVISVQHEEVLKPDFWRTDKDEEQGINAFIQPGDLLVLDEIWRFWDGFNTKDATGLKRPERVMNFYRMHRHFVNHETGLTCDVALITQDVADIHRSVKGVIEQTFQMTKMTSLGSSKRYRVDIYARYNLRRKPIQQLFRTYDKKYFGLYTSHSQKREGGVDPKEVSIDKRGNILSGKLFLFVIPVMLLLAGFSLYFVWGFLNPAPKQNTEVKSNDQTVAALPVDSTAAPQANGPPEPSQAWRIVGLYSNGSFNTLVLQNEIGATRYVVDPPGVRLAGLDIGAKLGNEVFSNWSGPAVKGVAK